MYVIESKLTDTLAAQAQIDQLYRPVLEMAFHKQVRGIVVVRHLTPTSDTGRVVDSLADAMQYMNGKMPILHWLGRGPI